MTEPFRWSSVLGISVGLFMIIGLLWVLIGVLTVPLHQKGADASIVFVSTRTDTAYFGDTPSHLLSSDPALDRFRTQMLTVIAGFLLLAGTLFIAVAWFGLRTRSSWALVALALGGVLAVTFWVVALLPYFRAGVRLTFADAPPFIWVPGILIVPASVLGWIGIR